MKKGDAKPLLLVADVGNTNAVFGVYRGEELLRDYRVSTGAARTGDEYAALLLPLLREAGLDPEAVGALMVSSVVPPVNFNLRRLGEDHFGVRPLFVEPGLDTGMEIRLPQPEEVGADRIVNAVAARASHGAPVVAVDFGTATTFDVVGEDGAYHGGVIAPGLGISAEALFARASRLYKVDVRRPEKVLGSNTSEAMQSGLYYGYIGLVDGILERLLRDLPAECPVLATGGYAPLIAAGSRFIDEVDGQLTLRGLRLICERNRSQGSVVA